MKVKIQVETEVEVTVERLAQVFCGLNDEQQAQFFVDAARIAEGFEQHQEHQWFAVGRHLKSCECSTDRAREMVRSLALATE